MNIINISKQKIFDTSNKVFAYELVFKDDSDVQTSISSNLKATSQLIVNSITSKEINYLLGKKAFAFINVDHSAFLKGILDVLDKDRFIFNILEDIELDEKVISKIIQYRKRGFRLSLEHFDSSAQMIKKFSRLFNYIDIIKMDVILSEPNNLENVAKKFIGTRIKLLAQNIETKEDYRKYFMMGFDYFQGYYLDKPEVIELVGSKDPTQIVILQLIKIIKDDNATEHLELFIKKQPDLSYKLIEFFNKSKSFNVKIESLTQVITLMGRNTLLRWLLVYLYSELSKNHASESVLDLALKRGERMELEALPNDKDKAYLAGMFSMLGSIFETNIKELMEDIKMDKDITSLVLNKKGKFAGSLMRAEVAEKDYLRKLMLANFENLNTADIIKTLEDSGVTIDNTKI